MTYPIYLKNQQGTEICKMISEQKQVFVRCKHSKRGAYEYALEKKDIDSNDIQFNYKYFSVEATAQEFTQMLKNFFSQIQTINETFLQNDAS